MTDALARLAPFSEIVCCPLTRSRTRLIDRAALLASVADADRERIADDVSGAFVSDAARCAYLVTGRIVNWLPEHALPLHIGTPSVELIAIQPGSADDIKRGVKSWYDEFGWQKNAAGMYHDTWAFSQDQPQGHGLYELLSHLSILDRIPGGAFVLDAGSGAIAHPEYLSYSWFYRTRVCLDISSTALVEASAKLREMDVCCLADICRLP